MLHYTSYLMMFRKPPSYKQKITKSLLWLCQKSNRMLWWYHMQQMSFHRYDHAIQFIFCTLNIGIIRSIRVWMNSMLIIWWHIQIKTDICANIVTFLLQRRWQPHPVAIVQIQLLSLQSLSSTLEESVTQHLLKRLQGIYHW